MIARIAPIAQNSAQAIRVFLWKQWRKIWRRPRRPWRSSSWLGQRILQRTRLIRERDRNWPIAALFVSCHTTVLYFRLTPTFFRFSAWSFSTNCYQQTRHKLTSALQQALLNFFTCRAVDFIVNWIQIRCYDAVHGAFYSQKKGRFWEVEVMPLSQCPGIFLCLPWIR